MKSYRVMQPWGPARGRQATLISEQATAADAFNAIDRLSAEMVRTGAERCRGIDCRRCVGSDHRAASRAVNDVPVPQAGGRGWRVHLDEECPIVEEHNKTAGITLCDVKSANHERPADTHETDESRPL